MNWLLTSGRIPFILLLAAVTAWFAFQAAKVGVEKTNASLMAHDELALRAYDEFRATFGSDEDMILAVRHPRLLESEGIAWIDALTTELSAIDGLAGVFSLTNAQQLVTGPLGAELAPLVAPPFTAPRAADALRTALNRNPDFTGTLISADRRTAGFVLEFEDRADDDFRAQAIAAVRAIMARSTQADIELHLTGVAVQKHDVSASTQRDQVILIPLALVILGAALLLFFRSWIMVLLPLTVTGIGVSWTLGTYHLAGLEVNAITALLPPVIMVLSLTVSVHIIQRWLDHEVVAPLARIRSVLRKLLFPCFFCSLTTAVGFGSLLMSNTPAVQQFGLFAALGALIALAAGMTLVPIGLTFLTPPSERTPAPQHRLLRSILDRSASVVLAAPKRVLLTAALVTLAAALAVPSVQNNTDLVRFLKSSAPLYQDTMFVDENLTGTQAIEYVVQRRDGAPLTTLPDVEKLAAFEEATRAHPDVTSVTSILAILRQVHRAESASANLALPAEQDDLDDAFDLLDAAEDPTLIRKLISPNFTQARVSVRTHALGTAVAAPLADHIATSAGAIFGSDYTIVTTGAFHRVAQDSNRLVIAQVRSFSIALLLVFVAIGLLFRSPRLALLSLIPNCMPIVWTAGLMGVLGIDLSTGTAMIASAVIGLVVDDTIHYLTGFYRNLGDGPEAAVRRTTNGIGVALVMNNLVLVLGFWVGAFGSFMPTIYFSLLSGITMLSALVCDMLVTPAALLVFGQSRNSTEVRP